MENELTFQHDDAPPHYAFVRHYLDERLCGTIWMSDFQDIGFLDEDLWNSHADFLSQHVLTLKSHLSECYFS